jgi:hypothetical protein
MVKRIKDDVVVFVEGGGDGAALQIELREAFAEFFRKSELGTARRPRVVACGSRTKALESYGTALSQGRNALVLVDSEGPVDQLDQEPPDTPMHWRPWSHLRKTDGWHAPVGAVDHDCHLMTQCMESWLLADWDALAKFYGQGFDVSERPAVNVETISKQDIFKILKRATERCKSKDKYGKGAHSFKLLKLVSPQTVAACAPWARRFLDELQRRRP